MIRPPNEGIEVWLCVEDAAIAQRDARIKHLQAQVRLLLARHFAPSSEKLPDGQLGLFNEAEASAAQEPESAPGTEVAAHRRATPKRAPLPDTLPRIDVEHPLAHDERACPHHGVELERFGRWSASSSTSSPRRCGCCAMSVASIAARTARGHLRTAPMPAQPLPRSLASPGLLAHVATAKYADALPTVSPAPATGAHRGRPLAHHAGDVDGARRRTRGPSHQPAAR